MSENPAAGVQATLAAWRERGADRLDPLRFHLIAAMAARAAHHEGQARRVLDERLARLVEQYEARLAGADPADTAAAQAPRQPPAPDTLAALLRHIAADAASERRGRYPELDLLDDFQATWTRLSTDRQLRQSRELVHENAGPLNSSHLVHRALSLMREQSPGYLHQFLSYLDALSWMDPPNPHDALAAKPSTRARKAPASSLARQSRKA